MNELSLSTIYKILENMRSYFPKNEDLNIQFVIYSDENWNIRIIFKNLKICSVSKNYTTVYNNINSEEVYDVIKNLKPDKATYFYNRSEQIIEKITEIWSKIKADFS